jgi:serine/threonine-protein kinase
VIKKIVKRDAGLKEARLLARLKHPHIVNIFGAGEDTDKAVVLMQYARGGSLSDRLVRRMPWKDVVAMLRACLDGLDFAHKNHIIHGNLRPSNVLISKDQEPWLSDFGLPEHYARNRANWYGAPEGKRGVQADIYALGVIMYQLWTNQLPVYDRHGNLSFSGALEHAHPGLGRVLTGMLKRNPIERFGSCEAVMDEIERMLKENGNRLPRLSARFRAWRRRRMGWFDWLLGFVSGVVAALLLTYLFGWLDILWPVR